MGALYSKVQCIIGNNTLNDTCIIKRNHLYRVMLSATTPQNHPSYQRAGAGRCRSNSVCLHSTCVAYINIIQFS